MSNGEKGWDGFSYPLQIKRKEDGSRFGTIFRGHLKEVLLQAETLNIALDTSEVFDRPFTGLQVDDLPDDLIEADFSLDDQQKICIVQWLESVIGINRASVSSGKTAMFAATSSFLKRYHPDARFIYITPSERLVRQSMKEMRKFLPTWNISQFGGGKRDPDGKDMVICTSAMINTHFTVLHKKGWFNTFMCVLFDESHHAASPSNQKILLSIPAFFRFGASDSTKEDNKEKFTTIVGLLGPILEHQVKAGSLIEAGRIAKPFIYVVDMKEWVHKYDAVPHQAEKDTPAFVLTQDFQWKQAVYKGPVYKTDDSMPDAIARDHRGNFITEMNKHHMVFDEMDHHVDSRWCLLERTYDKAIIRFKARNQLICDWVKYWSQSEGYRTLVVATRTTHVLILQSMLKAMVPPDLVRILFSAHDSRERDKTFDWFKSTPQAILVTPLVKEGVSINEIEAGVVADHVVDHEVANQIIGRFIRKKEGDNEAHITWFIDNQHHVMRRNSIKLFRKLEKIKGYGFFHPCRTPEDLPLASYHEPTNPNVIPL